MPRKKIPVDQRNIVLHEAGYLCSNPSCRRVLTLDMHHIEFVAKGGGDGSENLLALCKNCHGEHHAHRIPLASIRTWKMLQLALNHAYPKVAVDFLLALDHLGNRPLLISLDTILFMGALVTSGMLTIEHPSQGEIPARDFSETRFLSLSPKGRAFVAAWKAGDQAAALEL